MAGLLDFLQGASNSAASNVSAPVDGINWLLRKAGLPVSEKPFLGSDWMAAQGLTRQPQNRNMGLLGEAIGGIAPIVAAAKAPQIARGLLQGAENMAAPQVLRKESGMFIGPSAKTWDAEAASKAQQLAAKGADARAIWSETGTWKGPDGKWRQEIDDSAARMDAHSMRYLESAQAINPLKTGKLSDVLTHRKAYGAYPDAQDIGVDLAHKEKGGAYAARTEWGDPEQIAIGTGADPRSTTLHELQHAIQQREGFARGGSPNDAELMPFVRKMYAENIDGFQGEGHELLKMARHRAYQNLAGEAEARATQARIPLDAAQRRATFPEDSYDVPMNQLIIRGLLGN